jgi:RNA polymerase sigma factor (sigma-70 family)
VNERTPKKAHMAPALSAVLERTALQYDGVLHRMIMGRVRNAQDADDLAQEVYERFIRRSRSIHIDDVRGFLFGIAFVVLKEYWRRESERPMVSVELTGQATGESPESLAMAATESRELRNDLTHQFGKMPDAYRTVLVLLLEERLSYKEVARQMGISVSTVKVYRRKGLAWLGVHGYE